MVPAHPKIYHITQVANLSGIVGADGLASDARMHREGTACTTIGMGSIKHRRMHELVVTCHPATHVGDYVPFYFCPRSVMLYVISRGNHPDLSYTGGQRPVIHLVADLHAAVEWANANRVRWAFSLSNAGARYVQFRKTLTQLTEINWGAVASQDFREPQVKEAKQAECLIYDHFPWHLVERIGVLDIHIARQVSDALHGASHRPKIEVHPEWYF